MNNSIDAWPTYEGLYKLPVMTDDRITDKERKELRQEAQDAIKEYETTWCAC